MAARLGKRQIAQFVEHDEVHAGQMVAEPALAAVASLGLEPVDQIDDVVEAAAATGSDTASSNSNGGMVFPVPVPPTRTALRCWAIELPLARS